MTPREKRHRLFKKNRPYIRPFQFIDGNQYHTDVGLMWVAYQKGGFDLIPGIDQQTFAQELPSLLGSALLAEDKNAEFSSTGPVALIWETTDGWKVEPEVRFFPWATAANKLRVAVGYFQMIRHKKVGVCIVSCTENTKHLMDKCCQYGVIHRVGEIINGTPIGSSYIYSVRGKKNGL